MADEKRPGYLRPVPGPGEATARADETTEEGTPGLTAPVHRGELQVERDGVGIRLTLNGGAVVAAVAFPDPSGLALRIREALAWKSGIYAIRRAGPEQREGTLNGPKTLLIGVTVFFAFFVPGTAGQT